MRRTRTSAAADSGFSLIEVLIVVFVMALASSAILMTAPEPEPQIESDAAMLKAAIEDTASRAILLGRTEGLNVSSEGVERLFVRNGIWLQNPPSNIKFSESTTIDGIQGNVQGSADIVADATGMLSPMNLRMIGDGEAIELHIGADGQVTLARNDDPR